MQNSCISAQDEIAPCPMVQEFKQCKSQNIDHPGLTRVGNLITPGPPKTHAYSYNVIDTSQYCGNKTPKVVYDPNKCGSSELCCKIPSKQRYDNDHKRFVPKGATQDLTCDLGICETYTFGTGFTKSTTTCYNDTDCKIGQTCYNPLGVPKSAYEVSYYNPKMTCNQPRVKSQQTGEPIFCSITTTKYKQPNPYGTYSSDM